MVRILSSRMQADMSASFQAELKKGPIINVPALAEQIRLRNESENVALDDICAWLIRFARTAKAPMEFDGAGAVARPDGYSSPSA